MADEKFDGTKTWRKYDDRRSQHNTTDCRILSDILALTNYSDYPHSIMNHIFAFAGAVTLFPCT
jgi:hypothetical protein